MWIGGIAPRLLSPYIKMETGGYLHVPATLILVPIRPGWAVRKEMAKSNILPCQNQTPTTQSIAWTNHNSLLRGQRETRNVETFASLQEKVYTVKDKLEEDLVSGCYVMARVVKPFIKHAVFNERVSAFCHFVRRLVYTNMLKLFGFIFWRFAVIWKDGIKVHSLCRLVKYRGILA